MWLPLTKMHNHSVVTGDQPLSSLNADERDERDENVSNNRQTFDSCFAISQYIFICFIFILFYKMFHNFEYVFSL